MKISDIIEKIEQIAPLNLQESFDNSGLQVGDTEQVATGVLLTLDITEAVIDEAIERCCNFVVSHHPLLFHGVKRISNGSWIERIITKAIKNDIVLYSVHTNQSIRIWISASLVSTMKWHGLLVLIMSVYCHPNILMIGQVLGVLVN